MHEKHSSPEFQPQSRLDTDASTTGVELTPQQEAEIDKLVDQGMNYRQAYEITGLEYPKPVDEEYSDAATQPEPTEPVSVSLRDYYSALEELANLRPRINTSINYQKQTSEPGTWIYRKLARDAEKKGSDIQTEIGKSQANRERMESVAETIFNDKLYAKAEMANGGLITKHDADLLASQAFKRYQATYFGKPKDDQTVKEHDKGIKQGLKEYGDK